MINLPVLITAAVPVIGRYLQSAAADDRAKAEARAAEQQAEADRYRAEMNNARDILIDVSVRVNVLAFYVDEAMAASVFDRGGDQKLMTEDEETWGAYRDKLVQWKQLSIIDRANISQYFGDEALELLLEIQDDFNTLENQLKACHYNRTKSRYYIEDKEGSPNDFRTKYYSVRNPLDDKIRDLSVIMIRTCRSGSL